MTRRTAPTSTARRDPGAVRVALYRRASTDEGNQPYSLDAQDARLRAHVAGQDTWTVVEDYVERASGKDVAGRSELQRLLADAAAGRFDMVVVARIDRWSRSLVHLLDTVAHLDAAGVGFCSATEHFETSSPIGRLMLQMLGMFAEFERSLIIDRIVRGNAAKVARGLPLTSRVGYGLMVDEDGRITADPATIGVVRRIFDTYVNTTAGTRAIATALNADHLPGPGTKPWGPDAVSRVLRNRAFIGELQHRGTWHPGAHAPVIDQDLFDRAQARADHRRTPAAAARRRGDFLLSGTITCARCGGAYVGTAGTSANGTTVRYYSCARARRYGARTCDGPTLPADALETLVTDAVLDLYADTDLFTQAVTAHLDAHATGQEPLAEEATATRAALADKERVRAKYQADYEADRLSAARYETRAAELDEDITALRARLAHLEAATAQPTVPTTPSPDELAALRAHLERGLREGEAEVRKEFFAALVARLEVHDRDDIRPTFRLYDTSLTEALPVPAGGGHA